MDTVRISHAQRLPSNTGLPVEEIGLRTGLQIGKNFITKFKSTIGVTLGKYRKDSCAWRVKEKNRNYTILISTASIMKQRRII